MNYLTRRLLSAHFSHSSPSSSQPRKCISSIRALAAAIQQQSSFTSSITRTTRNRITKPEEPTASYVLNPPKMAKESGSASSWRRPSEIPFQGKAANSVKLFGLVQYPVQFQTLPDGKCVASIVIVQDNSEFNSAVSGSGSAPPLLIPVVFEGDLAHVVKCHVKESDCVYVSGQLSGDDLPFVVGGYEGNFHIVAQDVYFVEGMEGKAVEKKKNGAKSSDFENLDAPHEEINVKEMKNESYIVLNENGDQNESNSSSTTLNRSGTGSEDWKDLTINPSNWWDYRRRKAEGKVKAKYPDFKHKIKGVALWLDNAPEWVLERLQGVEFKSKQAKSGGKEEQWKNLVENPDKWWDNRSNKKNEKQPDFKNKESGEALWLNSAPNWAVSVLPPLPEKKVAAATWQVR